ncbi:MAG: hypothetical protein FWE08_07190 [Oscillospiraceae bacterium]|nr:hypothetical protein [Oscillospiraceae bacterium]
MLGKLLKYEFLATARPILPVYAGTLLLALFTRLLTIGGIDNIDRLGATVGLLIFLYVLSLVAIFVLTFLFIIIRFYTNMFRDQAYLTHTLPVSVDTLIWSKLIAAFVWSFAGFLVFLLSGWIVVSGIIREYFFLFDIWHEIFFLLNSIGFDLFLWVLSMIASTLSGILMFYAALSIGQLSKSAKILIAVLVYLGMLVAVSIVSTMFLFVMWEAPLVFNLFFSTAQGIGWYFIVRAILRHKVNLE